MVIFHSYVSLPEGTPQKWPFHLVCECEPLPNPSKMARKKGTLSLWKTRLSDGFFPWIQWLVPTQPFRTLIAVKKGGFQPVGNGWLYVVALPLDIGPTKPYATISHVFLPWMSIQSCMCTYNEICHMCVCVCTNIWLYMCIYIYIHYIYICYIYICYIYIYIYICYIYIYIYIYVSYSICRTNGE